MKTLRRLLPLLLALCLLFSACRPTTDPDGGTSGGTSGGGTSGGGTLGGGTIMIPDTPADTSMKDHTTDYDRPYTMSVSAAGKPTLLNAAGVPQIMTSALLRTDLLINADFMQPAEMEDYFAIAAETGLNTLEITVMWSQIETAEGVYDFSGLDCYLNFAKKYGLKLNIEWYGSFVDGETHTVNLPAYVVNDTKTYPLLADLFDYANYGRCRIMDWSNENLLARESRAVYEMMNHIYDWNAANGGYDPVIMVQLGQGVDRFQRWRVDTYDITGSDGLPLSSDVAWGLAQIYLNEIGRAVKWSQYKAVTRVEFCEQNAVVNYVRNIKALEFVDVVSPTYLHEISTTKTGIRSFTGAWDDMIVVNAENWASDNNSRQILATFGMGGSGYVSYLLSNPNYFPESPNGALYGRYDPSGETLAEKFPAKGTRAADTLAVNSALLRAYVAVANAPRTLFAAFGLNNLLNNKTGSDRIQRIYLQNGVLVTYSNPQGSLGFTISDGEYLYVWSSADASFSFAGATLSTASSGAFDENGVWVDAGSVTLTGGTTLATAAGEVYRIRVTATSALPGATDLKAQGYLSPLDSIRG